MAEKNINNENNIIDPPDTSGAGRSLSFTVILARRMPSILIIMVLCIAAAVFYIAKSTPIYTSTARLYVEQSGPKIISDSEGVMTGSKNYLYTQSELIKSDPILEAVAGMDEIKNLKTLTDKRKTLAERIKEAIGIVEPINLSGIDAIVFQLKKILDVKVGIKDDIITVSCRSEYPVEAAEIVNAVVNSYIKYQASQKKSTVLEVLKILQNEKIKRDNELSASFDTLLDFTRKNGVVSFDKNNDDAVFARLKDIADSLAQAQLDTINAKARIEAAQTFASQPAKVKQYAMAQPNTGSNLFTNDIELSERTELKSLQNQLEDALIQCSPDHPTVISLKQKISRINAELKKQLKDFADSYIDILRINYQTAQSRQKYLTQTYAKLRAQAQSVNIKATEYTVLEDKLQQCKKSSDELDDRIKDLNVSEDSGALNITRIESAKPMNIPSSPQRAKIVSVAMVLGLIFGIAFAVSREFMDCRLRGAEEISQALDVPVIGAVPSMGRRSKKNADDLGRKVHNEPKSLAAEAYRSIRTAIFFGVPKDEARTILITSPAPGDGKTTLVSNIAIAMAQAGQKTLIIDADFRKPMQHNIFGFKNNVECGLSSVLSGQVPFSSAIRSNGQSNLWILTSGPDVPNPSELLSSKKFTGLLKELTSIYDRIIVDSPPVTAVADSQILAALCDITVLVLRADKTTRKLAQQARDSLLGVGAKVLGAVVNDVSGRQNRYGYYSHYGYYGYGNGGKKK